MVAVIKSGHSIRRIFNYNEQKLNEGKAELLSAQNYPLDTERLSASQRLNMLLKQAELNPNVSRNSIHISLNFDPSETSLSKPLLTEIASAYMERIGFGAQPFLVYQHHDSGHPHLHIVSLKIRNDGSRIDTQNIGRNLSEPARKELEQKYGLVRAEDQEKRAHKIKSAYSAKVLYGKSETRRSIAKVLEAVLPSYKYTSLPELNAILRQYNVIADRGMKESSTYRNGGLYYKIIDAGGNPIGVPIKASLLPDKPTLQNLEQRFANAPAANLKTRIKNAIALSLVRSPNQSLQALADNLSRDGIYLAVRQNEDGAVYGLTYVDNVNRCVFNGSDLGKPYSAKGLLERLSAQDEPGHKQGLQTQELRPLLADDREQKKDASGNAIMDALLHQETGGDYVPYPFKKTRKKKKRKNISNNN